MKKLLSLFVLATAIAGYAAEESQENAVAAPVVKKSCSNCHCNHDHNTVQADAEESSSSEVAENSECTTENN